MADFLQTIGQQQPLSEAEQKKAGQSQAAPMGAEHEDFMRTILQLLDSKQIDVSKPQSILKMEVYNRLDEEWKGKVDLALVNIADLLGHIVEFRLSKKTPDASSELQSMIEYLWQMKQRIEEFHDVFKF
ncbi:MAG TPA: hypothetical protein DEB30_01940 [Candidatus Peribacter riflensis]|uniref:DUF1844 domain-containing protein n=1 Tax=Candidatus Peribacter riflensis TaxID=1735162 RepID=A0A0S1SKZ8_9BACT|nr:MAG: hypothetical protein PeribacterA2_0479 [Candidatus Peribacter riflensis]OGJ79284.1 MAG: hypothetical protein A2398_00525 [Candidatus Peribacteria bacterium RIFOXYB1_FULL_57_12]OGJ82477.1 MAG: hypothetical protein A2412_03220 [Candidatus Peribacteria bacterium RIFOXYC1_FULL_58_8]ALM10964.1 MAG: hypothetical protein PeribacterB2_0478 [Candidatus Peribacter riflensis]ALM12067.1 MAG: hypothetical protein PeribacterC2_0478 [Candidatus Peribacter riflensis]